MLSVLNFTAKEKIFIERLAQGDSYEQIANHLGVSSNTVRDRVRSVYKKLGVNTRTRAVVKYQQTQAVETSAAHQMNGHPAFVTTSLINMPAAQLRQAAILKEQIETMEQQLGQLLLSNATNAARR